MLVVGKPVEGRWAADKQAVGIQVEDRPAVVALASVVPVAWVEVAWEVWVLQKKTLLRTALAVPDFDLFGHP